VSRLTLGLAALRLGGIGALVLALASPAWLTGPQPDDAPLVLLDASLSLAGHGGRWVEALDSARRLGTGGVVWRFGARVASFDTTPPSQGASRLQQAAAAASARAGAITVVTDGELSDVATLPADLRRRPRVVTLARPAFRDVFVAEVRGQRRLATTDTLRLAVLVGVAGGSPEPRPGSRSTALVVRQGERRLAARAVVLPDSGTIVVEVAVPASRLPAGVAALTVALDGAGDVEPRDDVRWLVVETVAQPPIVVLADPPDWESRFLARALAAVARAPVRTFVRLERRGPWRDAGTLQVVSEAVVSRAVARASLVAHASGTSPPGATPRTARLVVGEPDATEGDWYVTPPPPSPLASALAGIGWDSLPPLTAAGSLGNADAADTAATVVLTAARARRGRPVPVVRLAERDGQRVATLGGAGWWRWAFRGGASDVAYRAVVAALVDWLIRDRGAGSRERFAPTMPESPNALPLTWRWEGRGAPTDAVLRLTGLEGEREDTLRFDASGLASLALPSGVYRYAAADGPERGMVVVESYSDEWRPRPVALDDQAGMPGGARSRRGLRDAWWLYALAIAAFAVEWYWRRRVGLP